MGRIERTLRIGEREFRNIIYLMFTDFSSGKGNSSSCYVYLVRVVLGNSLGGKFMSRCGGILFESGVEDGLIRYLTYLFEEVELEKGRVRERMERKRTCRISFVVRFVFLF